MLPTFPNGIEAMVSEYSLSIVLEKIYENQLTLEVDIMEQTLQVERQDFDDARTALGPIGEYRFYKAGLEAPESDRKY